MESILINILPPSLETLGTVFVAFAALRVHHRVLYEHQIDDKVFKEMRREWKVGVFGVSLIVGGYAIEMFSFFM